MDIISVINENDTSKSIESSPESFQDEGDFFGTSTENALLIDCDLGIVAMGDNVRRALGSLRDYRDLAAFLVPSDAFRLEQFIIRNTPYSQISILEVTLSGAGRFKHAFAGRQSVFGHETVVVEFFADKRTRLLADKIAGEYFRRSLRSDALAESLANAERNLDRVEKTHPAEAGELRAIISSLVRRNLAAALIGSIVDPGKERRASFDAKELSRTAANYVKNALSGANVEMSFFSKNGKSAAVYPGVSPEHMWHLVTCALTSVVGVSGHGRTVFELYQDSDTLKASFTAPCGEFANRLPPDMTLGELRDILAPSTLRLYICELICEEYDIASSVVCVKESLTISFTFKLQKVGRSFDRFEVTAALLPQYWGIVTDAIVIPDAPFDEKN